MPANRSTTRATSANGDKPADVSLNLDTLEREGGEPEPFVITLAGDRFVFRDVGSMDWRELLAVDESDPHEILRALLGKDYDKFCKHPLPTWKLNRLMDDWRQHTGLESAGEALGSSTS